MNWTQEEAIWMASRVEDVCPDFGCHVALTGGCLYKSGPRKDLDLIFYRIRQSKINPEGLFAALQVIGIVKKTGFGWCVKAEYKGKNIDCLFPEETHGDQSYGEDELFDPADKVTTEDLLAFENDMEETYDQSKN